MDYVEFITKKFDEMKELFLAKNEQYGTGDPLANFRTAALMNSGEDSYEAMYEQAKAFCRKHIAHIENHGIDGVKVAESLGDNVVYNLIMMYMIEAWKAEQAAKTPCDTSMAIEE